jgi:prophage antirepressor-like protein
MTAQSSAVVTFNFVAQTVRIVMMGDEPWFVAADVCEVLEIAETHRALARLDDDEKGRHTMTTPGGNQEVSTINESGLYSLILTSRKPEAKKFKKWVTSEVLPAIRKTGHYELPNAAQTLLLSEQQTLSELIHAKARTAPDPLYRKAVSEIWSRFKNKFRVPRYADLPRDQLTDAILYVNALELHCVKRLEADGNPPFLQGEIGTRLLIRLEGGGRYSVTPLGLTELVVDLADLVAIDQALDAWRDFAKRKELGYYRAGVANLRSNGH